MKRGVFVLMQGMSHKNLSFKSILCMVYLLQQQGSDIKGSQKGA